MLGGELGATGDAELAEGVRDVGLDGRTADDEPLRELRIGKALGDENDDREFRRREAVPSEVGSAAFASAPLCELDHAGEVNGVAGDEPGSCFGDPLDDCGGAFGMPAQFVDARQDLARVERCWSCAEFDQAGERIVGKLFGSSYLGVGLVDPGEEDAPASGVEVAAHLLGVRATPSPLQAPTDESDGIESSHPSRFTTRAVYR